MRSRHLILIVDDSADDILILTRAFRKAGIDVPITSVRDGQEALEYLAGEDNFADRHAHPLPRLLVLDLKMPRLGGLDVLKWLQKHPRLKRLPVAVLTSSDEDRDVNHAYDLGANSYIVKPASLPGYEKIVTELRNYWLML